MSRFSIEPPRLPLAARPCKGCGRPIYGVTTQAGKRTCLDRSIDHGSDASGRHVMVDSDDSHWGTCVARERFARKAAHG